MVLIGRIAGESAPSSYREADILRGLIIDGGANADTGAQR